MSTIARQLETERHAAILEAMRDTKVVRVESLAESLGVSVATVRRDLSKLGAQGSINRLFGGASSTSQDLSFAPRKQSSMSEKTRIAKAVVALITEGEVVALDTGTTVLAVAAALQDFSNLTVVTNSVEAMLVLQSAPRLNLMVTGGVFDSVTRSFQGPLVGRFYSEYRADVFVMGAGSISPDGVRDSYVSAFPGKQAALAAAGRAIVVADSSKFRLNALGKVSDWDQIETLVTDEGAPPEIVDAIRMQGVTVVVA